MTQLPTSSTITLEQIRDFYGDTGSISLNDLYKGGSLVPNPSSLNSGTQTTSASNANSAIGTSGEIALNDFYGAQKQVAPVSSNFTVNSQSGDNGARAWVGVKNSTHQWYQSGYNYNYANVAGTANAGQILYFARWGLAGNTASVSITFRVNKTGEYYCAFISQGNGGGQSVVTIGGSGVASGGVTNNSQTFNTLQTHTPTFTANTDITITGSTTTAGGGGGDVILGYVRTNCNADGVTIGSNAGNNYMLTTYQN
tara:strand:+ start:1202 stop:1966 length:765 start_codon:yes stop_codon:yes gene_type:complete